MKNLLNLFVFPLLILCGYWQMNSIIQEKLVKSENSLQEKNQIGYLFFKVSKSDSGPERVTLESKKVTEGRLKITPVFDRNSVGIGDFIVSLTDSNGKEIAKQLVEDPLNQHMESFDKEGISRHKVSSENAEFSIRYSHSSDIKIVRVEKVTNAGNQLLCNQKL